MQFPTTFELVAQRQAELLADAERLRQARRFRRARRDRRAERAHLSALARVVWSHVTSRRPTVASVTSAHSSPEITACTELREL